ncbi:hypothetical protein F5Y00DRAFT_268024 [Daldinia vernicosa]|uniref:uncharacterized protein n=1 Tax=Daldinia vernicosa TaxID=114800 RepID=UPI0020089492|nr:uncharacterized protein F5Y00DRAFT_268024 [Daldinia vernicosa]KAI0850962.1 hypothetical protein F5Y00DRAFT_268024 [Daldinia vernicosa]
MTPLRALLPMLALIALAVASQNLTTYLPECAQPCIESSISKNSNCTGTGDVKCLCSNIRSIGPGSLSCAQGACSNSSEQLAYELHSEFVDYCSDNGEEVSSDFSGGGSPPVWTASWGKTSSPTASATSMTSPVAATKPPSNEQQSPSDPDGGGLSGGAIAGIAVGVGVACILITGGLLLYAFRLGRRHSKRTQGEEPAGPGPREEGGGDYNGIDNVLEAEKKVQLEGAPVSELPTEHTLSGFHPVKELATHEKPVELSADPVPSRANDGNPILPTPWK